MRQKVLFVIGAGVLALVAFFFIAGTGGHAQSRTVWEYRIVHQRWDEKQMNSLGSDGWELVAVDASTGDGPRAFFKRARQ